MVRYQYQGKEYYGIVEEDEIIQLSSYFIEIINNDLKINKNNKRLKYNEVKILEPVKTSKVINFV
ncbi:Rv2993c-like domain-containing protein [Salibacterium aidingense]|uniref:Rv2993c-like domain-containing protein n=1 Tax=Salibacterium aidingense TaxID=384933 RepID=UPI003BE4325F